MSPRAAYPETVIANTIMRHRDSRTLTDKIMHALLDEGFIIVKRPCAKKT